MLSREGGLVGLQKNAISNFLDCFQAQGRSSLICSYVRWNIDPRHLRACVEAFPHNRAAYLVTNRARRSLFSPAACYSRGQWRSPSDHQKLALSSNVYVEHADHLQVRYRHSVRGMTWQKRNSSA
jgi:hypothetical protein